MHLMASHACIALTPHHFAMPELGVQDGAIAGPHHDCQLSTAASMKA